MAKNQKTKHKSETNHQQQPESKQNKKKSDSDLLDKFEQLQQDLVKSQEREKRLLADYQNLIRRSEQERSKIAKFANRDLIEALLPVISNLDKAAQESDNELLDMVSKQLWSVLDKVGLERIEAEGEEFNVDTMEAVDKQGKGKMVIKVVEPGYRLKGEVIQYAKVVLGDLD